MSGKTDSKYTFELYNADGDLIADLTGIISNRRFTLTRNDADDISFSINLDEFEAYCRGINVEPRSLLVNGQTEVKVRRGSTYLAGGQVCYKTPKLSGNSASVEVRAAGFLNLFKDRFTDGSETYLATQATSIGWGLINTSQLQTNGDFGITEGTLATVGLHNKTYKRYNIKDALVELTQDKTRGFDMEITPHKVFNTYIKKGSTRNDIVFSWPGNIKEFSAPEDGTQLANEVVVFGAGYDDAVGEQATETDAGSQATVKLRQKLVMSNSRTDDQGELTNTALVELEKFSFPFEVLKVKVDGNISPFVTDYGIGDYVHVVINNYALLDHIDSLYRIEQISVNIDDNDNEDIDLGLS